jgi:4-diphosphocytidyl-2-C-methyl-D-erythritol kinase
VTVSASVALVENAPAKVNLTLRVLRRRADGYHELESVVAFAGIGDRLSLTRGDDLSLTLSGPSAALAGEGPDNLVLKAARTLAARVGGLRTGAFHLDKMLPVAAGLGGGSADAAAALRLLAKANDLSKDDPRLYEAARATGADVPVCLDPRVRVMRGIGDILSEPLDLPALPAVLANPGIALATKAVFAGWKPAASSGAPSAIDALATATTRQQLLEFLSTQSNDLEAPAIAIAPAIDGMLDALRALAGCELARMSGSGSTCFGVYASDAAARGAAAALRNKFPQWWVEATSLGSAV